MWRGVHVQSHASYNKVGFSYTLVLDQGYMCFLMKHEKRIKTLSDQQCSFQFLVSLWFLIVLLKVFQWFSKINNSIVSKWYYSLDDKCMCRFYSMCVKFNIDFSFSEIRRFYSIKFKKSYPHRQTAEVDLGLLQHPWWSSLW